jgi:hypothetical protein
MSNQISIGSRVKTAKGTEGKIAQILEGGYLLDTGKRIRHRDRRSIAPQCPAANQISESVVRERGRRSTANSATNRISHSGAVQH